MGEVNETGGSREAIEAVEAFEAVETFDAFEAADAVHFSHLQVQELPTNPVGACRRMSGEGGTAQTGPAHGQLAVHLSRHSPPLRRRMASTPGTSALEP